MAEASDNSCSSEDDEYSDPLEEAASAGARLSVPEKASISRKRVFSLLQNAFSKQQGAALEETVETSVMLRYNDNILSAHEIMNYVSVEG